MDVAPARTRSVHRLAFEHYLRTGERLTEAEWLARAERKFNPYHDEIGRFTSPPGVTVSYGRSGPPSAGQRTRDRPLSRRAGTAVKPTRSPTRPLPNVVGGSGFRSALVRDSVADHTSHADSIFELNKRQAALDTLRRQAGPNPGADVRADLADFQRRLDADRARLKETAKVADREITELMRAGLAPVDIAVGAAKIANGKGELRDYLAVAGAIPVGAVVGKGGKILSETARVTTGEVVQLGGAYRHVKKLLGYDAHHMPPKSVSPLPHGDGPAIAMLPRDHRLTASHGAKAGSKHYRLRQAQLINDGKFREAIALDILDIRKNHGQKYDEAIEQMLKYLNDKGF